MGRHEMNCIFDLYIRKNPFGGAYTFYAGLSAVIEFLENYKFDDEEIEYLKSVLDIDDPDFFKWLRNVDLSKVKLYSLKEGTIAFPYVPFIRVEGPLAICQLLETTLLNLVNFASLITTNAVRMRLAAGKGKRLLEFGLRRAQGPDGAMTASRYCKIAGFDATSNAKASQVYGINIRGTHSHAYVSSFRSFDDIKVKNLKSLKTGEEVDLLELSQSYLKRLNELTQTNVGELAAFVAYAVSWPNSFTVLIDTYNTLKSGLINFSAVALALFELGYKPGGVRLDSGDLSYLSKEVRGYFRKVAEVFSVPEFKDLHVCCIYVYFSFFFLLI